MAQVLLIMVEPGRPGKAGLLSSEAYAAQTDSVDSCPVREYVYDALGRIVTERQLLENGEVSETHYRYSGFSMTKTDPDGRVKTDTRDCLGRTVRVEETSESRMPRISYSYNAAGDLMGMTDPTGHSVKDKEISQIVKDSVLNAHIVAAIMIVAICAIVIIVGAILMLVGVYYDNINTGLHRTANTKLPDIVADASRDACRTVNKIRETAASAIGPSFAAIDRVEKAYRILFVAGTAVTFGAEALNWVVYGIRWSVWKKKETNEEGYAVLTDFPELSRNNLILERSFSLPMM